ncbi:MAG: DUF4268 domain-containing protein [Deltaproteobacteria bacterium]|nr:DUF4268 domain-containing protein [Deltaproteobacteria bacterium]
MRQPKESWVELCIQKPTREESQEIYSSFLEKKAEIESSFSESLRWISKPRISRRRIASQPIPKGRADRDDWGALQDELIDKMIRLRSALKGHGVLDRLV